MNFAMKKINRTVVATIFAIFFLGMVISMMLDIITFDEFKSTIAVATPVVVMIIGWLTAD